MLRETEDSPLFLSTISTTTEMVAYKYADMLAIAATASSGVFTGVLRVASGM